MGRHFKASVLAIALAIGGTAGSAQTVPRAPAQAAATFGNYHPASAYGAIATTSFYLPMRDGTRLAVQVSRPAAGGKPVAGRFPVIWEAGIALPPVPAGKPADNPAAGFADWSRLVHSGYVIVTVARRGNGQSMGTVRGYNDREEAYDAYEITEWLARQPWSDGMVGMHGCSNTGEAVMHALTVAPPHLKAAWAGCFGWTKYDGFLRGGGIIANWGAGPQRTIDQDMRQRPVDVDFDKQLLHQAALDHQRNSNLGELLRSVPYRDSWSPLSRSAFVVEDSIGTYMDQIRRAAIPLTIQGGWYDDFRGQGLIAWANLPGTRILIGPWKHCRSEGFDLIGEAQRFFDFHLKHVDTGLAAEAPIHYFTTSAGWRSAAAWPPAGAAPETLYLSMGELRDRPQAAPARSFIADPDPNCGDTAAADANLAGPFLQPCHRDRGTISFANRPAVQDRQLVGSSIVRIWITASASDANLFGYLEDVAPDGRVTMIADGRLKASLRRRREAPWAMLGLPWHRGYAEDVEPLHAGEPAELVFDLLPAAFTIKAGHRLQLTLAGSDPRERGRTRSTDPLRLSLITDAAHPSSVTLPFLAAGT